MGVLAIRLLRDAAGSQTLDKLARAQQAIVALNRAIADFVTRLSRTEMSLASVQRLATILRVARYYKTVSELAVALAAALAENTSPMPDASSQFAAQAQALLDDADPANATA